MHTNSKSRLSELEIHDGSGLKIGVIAARFNKSITQKLLDGAKRGLIECGVSASDVKVVWVPGAFEIPLVAKQMAQSGQFDALIAVGAVIRGETYHFEVVANQAAFGVSQASLETGVPIIFSVVTTETLQQAEQRSGETDSNHGYTGALSAVEMVHTLVHAS